MGRLEDVHTGECESEWDEAGADVPRNSPKPAVVSTEKIVIAMPRLLYLFER